MAASIGKISITCIEVDAKYVLQFEGVDWSESLPSIEAAIRRAGQLVVEQTEVTVFDTTGHGVVVTTLFPAGESAAWAQSLLDHNPGASSAAVLKSTLATKGVRGALQFLNSLTPHRFTSLYHFDGPTLRNITFYDRQNPAIEACEDIPVEASYCVFVRDTGGNFVVPDSSRDERVSNHPKRETVRRYCGVPLLDKAGKMFGSICHFDFEPGAIDGEDVGLLEHMAGLLRTSLQLPPKAGGASR